MQGVQSAAARWVGSGMQRHVPQAARRIKVLALQRGPLQRLSVRAVETCCSDAPATTAIAAWRPRQLGSRQHPGLPAHLRHWPHVQLWQVKAVAQGAGAGRGGHHRHAAQLRNEEDSEEARSQRRAHILSCTGCRFLAS